MSEWTVHCTDCGYEDTFRPRHLAMAARVTHEAICSQRMGKDCEVVAIPRLGWRDARSPIECERCGSGYWLGWGLADFANRLRSTLLSLRLFVGLIGEEDEFETFGVRRAWEIADPFRTWRP